MRRPVVVLVLMVACVFTDATGVLAQEESLAGTCRASMDISYPEAGVSSEIGDLVHIQIKLGARTIRGGTSLSINRVRFNLDCNNANLGINCPDDGGVVSYQGDLTTTCGVTMTADHGPGETLPNQVVFTPSAPIVVPAGNESYCSLDFLVRIETLSNDATPLAIEQVGGFDASTGDGVCNTSPPLGAGRTISAQICVGAGCETRSTSCEPLVDLIYPGAPNLLTVGETVRARLSFGAGLNGHGAPIVVHRARFNLDCNNANLGINCPDDGPVVSYQGHLTTTCPVAFTSSHSPGDTLPNQVVFTADGPLVVPAETSDYCSLDFDLRLETRSSDGTPDVIEQVIGMDGALGDALCDVAGAGSESGAAFLLLCPVCNDGNQCNGLEYCDGDTGCAAGTPILCDDHDACTDDSCNPDVYDGDPCVFASNAGRCDDHDACTDDACDPDLGCVHADNSARCDDGNPCTTDTCDPADGCEHSPSGACGTNPRGIGYWKRLCHGPHPSGDFYTAGDVACLAAACPFRSVLTIADLCERLSPAPPNDACARSEAQLLVLELNLCRGRVSDSETIHPSCGAGTTVGEARAFLEARLCDPSRTVETCRDASCAAEEIASGRALGVTSLRARGLPGGGVALTWDPPYVADDSLAPPRYRVWRRPGSETAFVQIAETRELAYADIAAPAAGAQYEISVVW
jgi:hypothetical protein